MSGPLEGIRVLDMSRVLAGPSCCQLLGDLGAEVIKVERPKIGDETRTWGPPFLRSPNGDDTSESAYYLSANRNKRSVTIDFSRPGGAALIRRLLANCDVLVENLKVGGMKKYGLAYDDLRGEFPGLVFCSITGYGQTGPYADRPGYDMMAQGIGGIMSITGEADGPPVKVGVAINDVMSGMYATVAILSALRHRDRTGNGQYIDVSLLDVQVGWLYNQGLNYLCSGEAPGRLGTAHPNSSPYQAFPASDGYLIVAANNDRQFERFCKVAGSPELLGDERYATNPDRVRNRDALVAAVSEITRTRTIDDWIESLSAAGVGCAPINTIDRVFNDPQVRHRQMRIEMTHPLAGDNPIDLIGNPIKFSETPVSYRSPPPIMGQHTGEILQELLNIADDELEALRGQHVI
ncbi:MAG: CoA transferase [Alphaproteobacteria bacterium]|nr:CoA transferase [Alphaproteobacteria bacterium]